MIIYLAIKINVTSEIICGFKSRKTAENFVKMNLIKEDLKIFQDYTGTTYTDGKTTFKIKITSLY